MLGLLVTRMRQRGGSRAKGRQALEGPSDRDAARPFEEQDSGRALLASHCGRAAQAERRSPGHPKAGVLGAHSLRRRPWGVRCVRRTGFPRGNQVRGAVEHRFPSRLVRRALVVGGGHRRGRRRGRPASAADPPARGGPRFVRGRAVRARRPGTSAGDHRRLGRVTDWWRQRRSGEGAGLHGRWRRQLDGPATRAWPRGFPGEHPGWHRRHLRWAVLQPGDRRDADPGGCPPGRTTVQQDPGHARSSPGASPSGFTSPSPAPCS